MLRQAMRIKASISLLTRNQNRAAENRKRARLPPRLVNNFGQSVRWRRGCG
jgi:hypothetical protein